MDISIVRCVLAAIIVMVGLPAAAQVNVQVDDENEAPEFTSTPVTEATTGQQYSYTATAQDPDGDQIVLSSKNLPGWLSLDDQGNGSATLTGTPPEGGGRSGEGGNGEGRNGEGERGGRDDDDDEDSDDSWLLPGKTWKETITLIASDGDEEGEQEFEVTIADAESDDSNDGSGGGGSSPGENQLPVANDDSGTTGEDSEVVIDVLANDGAPGDDELYVTAVSSPEFGTASINSNGTVTYTPAPDYFGEDQFTYQMEDAYGFTDEAQVTVTVRPVNDRPRFSLESHVTVRNDVGRHTVENLATSISPGPSNESGQELTFDVSVDNTDLFARAPVIDAETGHLTFAPAEESTGTAEVTVILRDDGGTDNGGEDASEARTFTIEVTEANKPPEFTSEPATNATAGKQYSYTARASDPDGDALTITAAKVPGWLSFSDNDDGTGSLEGTPAENHVGEDEIVLRASDGEYVTEQTFSVTVTAGNSPPSISGVDDQETTVNTPIDVSGISVADKEAGAHRLDVSATSSNQSILPDENIEINGEAAALTLILTPVEDQTGFTTVTVTVSDGELESSTSFHFRVVAGQNIPETYLLRQNYPNPFNPSTTIEYGLPEQSHVRLAIFNAVGERVALLIDESQEAGWHRVVWHAGGNRSGPYFYQLQTGSEVRTKKLLFLK